MISSTQTERRVPSEATDDTERIETMEEERDSEVRIIFDIYTSIFTSCVPVPCKG